MIGIICESCINILTLLNNATIIKEEISGQARLILIKYCDQELVILITGYGKVNIGYALGVLGEKYNIDTLIGVGTCGSLCFNNTKINDLVLVSSTMQGDVNFSGIGYPPPELPNLPNFLYETNDNLTNSLNAALKALDYKGYTGRVISLDRFINNSRYASSIVNNYHGDFVDNMTAYIGQIAFLMKVPFTAILGISYYPNDTAGFDYYQNQKESSNKASLVVMKMLENKKQLQP